MSVQRYGFFGEILQRYFRPAIGAYPQMGEHSSSGYLHSPTTSRIDWRRPGALRWQGAKPRPRTPESLRNSS